jgi:hypothetical protein
VPDLKTAGIEVQELSGASQRPDVLPPTLTAFIGTARRGPVGEAVKVWNLAEFHRTFGGYLPGTSLAPALEQYFLQGGQTAVVVRLVNGARPVSLGLPCADGRLKLLARDPGASEVLRAAVDYDEIGENEAERFNLVVQRLAEEAGGRIVAQESFTRLSVNPAHPRYVCQVLNESRLLLPPDIAPLERPLATTASPGQGGFVLSRRDGDDGLPLTDYDIIGSAVEGRGLFSLRAVSEFDLLCIPRTERGAAIGPAALLAALRYCRQRGAILIVDPPRRWGTPAEVLAGLDRLGLTSEDAVMAFPWLRSPAPRSGAAAEVPPSAVLAGLIARTDAEVGCWAAPSGPRGQVRGGLRPVWALTDKDVLELARHGVNGFQLARPGACVLAAARTLAGRQASSGAWRYLPQRRLALAILRDLERDTRWVVFERNGPALWKRIHAQVSRYLDGLHRRGALQGATPAEAYFVKCDGETNDPLSLARGEARFVVGFATLKPACFNMFQIGQRLSGTRIRAGGHSPYAQ